MGSYLLPLALMLVLIGLLSSNPRTRKLAGGAGVLLIALPFVVMGLIAIALLAYG